jgi:hypothetical protein
MDETMEPDPTEGVRRRLLAQINSHALNRSGLEARHGRVWDAVELARDFEVLGFAAPFVVVRRRADQRLGSLLFQHEPRFYFAFRQDE